MPSLNDILGQGRAVQVLRSCIASGRLHHAWVFYGPKGVGKGTTAQAFGATLLEPGLAPNLAGELEPDPDSHTQRMIAAGTHPDLRIVRKELAEYSSDVRVRNSKQKFIPLDVIKEHVVRPAQLGKTAGHGALASRVFIIEEAHLMAHEGANALLKVLEEPAPGVTIILLTDRESHLPPTIRSRCQRVAFAPLDDEAMRAWYTRSGLGLAPDHRDWVLAFAQGSPGEALRAHEAGLYDWAKTLQPLLDRMEQGAFPAELGGTMTKLVEGWANEWVKAHPNASKEAANKDGVRMLMALFASWARRRLHEARNAPERIHRVRAIDLVFETESAIDRNVNIGIAMDNFAAQLARR
ncbi:MAG: AAA family ATPase [Phycisphaerales bacterium]|nr:MAG: AAA family ATPase [Phycisphaerales bacterium]